MKINVQKNRSVDTLFNNFIGNNICLFFLVYWLEQWHLFYKNQISKFSTNTSVIFISYEDLCKNKDTKNKLIAKINLNNAKDDFLFKLSHKNITETYDDNLLNKCKELEAELL